MEVSKMSDLASTEQSNENLGYDFALEIYHCFFNNGASFDDYLWLQDTQTACRALNQKGKMFNKFLLDNTLSKDGLGYCFALTKPSDISIIKTQLNIQLETIKKAFPTLKNTIENLFDRNPYFLFKGESINVNHDHAVDFVEFIVALKELVYPLVLQEIEQKGQKADADFLNDLLKWFKANELFVRSAILISCICHICSYKEPNKQRWIDILNKNNTFYFNKTAKKFDNVYHQLKVQALLSFSNSSFIDKKLSQEIFEGGIVPKFDQSVLNKLFNESILMRSNAYKEYRELGLQIFLDYID